MNSSGVFQSVVLLLAFTVLAGSLIYLQSHTNDQTMTGQTAAKTTELLLKFDNYRHNWDKETTRQLAQAISDNSCALPNQFQPHFTPNTLCNATAQNSSRNGDSYAITVNITCNNNFRIIKKTIKFEKQASATPVGGVPPTQCQIQITDTQSTVTEYSQTVGI